MDRFYRSTFNAKDLVYYRVKYKQTDLCVASETDCSENVLSYVKNLRSELEEYIKAQPDFAESLVPIQAKENCPSMALDMINASKLCDVGPMAAVAGAIAEETAKFLHFTSENVIIENGGDLYMFSSQNRIVSVYAVNNTLNQKLRLEIETSDAPVSICTSSATYGHSLSFGKADSVTVISKSGSLADAAATALCNMVKCEKDISDVIDRGSKIEGISGIVIVCGKKIGAWGNVKFV